MHFCKPTLTFLSTFAFSNPHDVLLFISYLKYFFISLSPVDGVRVPHHGADCLLIVPKKQLQAVRTSSNAIENENSGNHCDIGACQCGSVIFKLIFLAPGLYTHALTAAEESHFYSHVVKDRFEANLVWKLLKRVGGMCEIAKLTFHDYTSCTCYPS